MSTRYVVTMCFITVSDLLLFFNDAYNAHHIFQLKCSFKVTKYGSHMCWSNMSKTENRHGGNLVATGGSGGCRYENLWFSLRRQTYHHVDSLF